MKSKAPLLLLFALTLALIFIVGVRYGQHVEKTNKQNAYTVSLTPQPLPTAKIAGLTFKTFNHKPCGVQFIYPDSLTKKTESTTSARFVENEMLKLAVSCDKTNPFLQALKEDKTATGIAKLNTLTGKQIYFFVSKDLLPLIENSLKFR